MRGLAVLGISSATGLMNGLRDVHARTPKRGGRITAAYTSHGPTDTLDPILSATHLDHARGRAHYNNLLQFNDDLSVRPELAESFESNSDATEFTFHLRKGVTWHDGKDFDADDVVYSMNRHLGEDSVSRATGLVAAINEWKRQLYGKGDSRQAERGSSESSCNLSLSDSAKRG